MAIELYWGTPVILYFFLGGLGAGAVIVGGHVYHLSTGAGTERFGFTVARYGAFIGPLPVIIGTGMLIYELGRPFRVVNLFKLVNQSPMNAGSWLLFFFIILSVVYAITFIPRSSGPGDKLEHLRKTLAWFLVPVAYGVAVYPGVMLGATPGRPFWNSSVLPILFLLSAVSGGIASIVLADTLFRSRNSDSETEGQFRNGTFTLLAWDTLVLALELLTILLFVVFAYLTVESATAAIRLVLAGGALAIEFWIGVVLIAIIIPLAIEIPLIVPTLVYGRPFRTHRIFEIVVPIAILAGGLILRYLVVVAGQIAHPVGI